MSDVIHSALQSDRSLLAVSFALFAAAGGISTTSDALETVDRYEGPFDVVLIDHQKHRYPEAFEAIKSKVPVGGVIVADNAMTAGSIQFEKLLETVETGQDPAGVNEDTRGIATYLDDVRTDPAFETVILPLGEGIAASYRTE